MARPKKDASPNLAQRHSLTAGAIERLVCPAGKLQVFLRDSEVPGLRVRVTSAARRPASTIDVSARILSDAGGADSEESTLKY